MYTIVRLTQLQCVFLFFFFTSGTDPDSADTLEWEESAQNQMLAKWDIY